MMYRTNRRTGWAPVLALAGVLWLAACAGEPAGSLVTPGSATVSVTANPEGIAAFTVTISGGDVDDVRSTGDGLLYWETVSGVTRVAGVLPTPPVSGALFTLHVPDTRLLDRYRVQVDQVADVETGIGDAGEFAVRID